MKIAVIGGGILGLTLGYRLAGHGHSLHIFEEKEQFGGLACPHDYGDFTWDRFYHVILKGDQNTIDLVNDLGLGSDLQFQKTGTGYYSRGAFHDMSGNLDFLRFPLLSMLDKARLCATVLYATRFADPWELYTVSAEEWLTQLCGKRGYDAFWRPLLRSKFGTFHDQIAAVFIWATLKRLVGARSKGTSQESMGYVRGGYKRIVSRLEEALQRARAVLRVRARVTSINAEGHRCRVTWGDSRPLQTDTFDQVFFTGPTAIARNLAVGSLSEQVAQFERSYPSARDYLGVTCLVAALKRRLTRYYVLNIGDENIEATGVIEMTNLVDRYQNTAGHHLVYVPQYMDSHDPRMDASDEVLTSALLGRGLSRIFTDLKDEDFVYRAIHRTRFVQPLPLVRHNNSAKVQQPPSYAPPFQILNTSMLTCATLNNNEVIGLANQFVKRNAGRLGIPHL